MEDRNTPVPIGIQPKNVFGLRTDVVGNIHFAANEEVIYPVEGVLAFHDYVSRKQKFLRFSEKVSPAIISISPNRKVLAVVEVHEEKTHTVNIYDLASLKRRRSLQLPAGIETPAIETIDFTFDSKGIVVLTKAPEETLVLFLFDKADTMVQGRAANTNLRGVAQCISCNIADPGLVAVGGDNVFKLMSRSEKGFSLGGNFKCDGICITSLAWVSMEMLIAGTSKGLLLFVENGYLKIRYDAFETDVIDLSLILDPEEGAEQADVNLLVPMPGNEKRESRVVCLTSFTKGFAFAIFNKVYVFECTSKFRFQRKTLITIQIDIYPEPLYQITNIAINAQQDSIIATAKHSQIYMGVLYVPESLTVNKLDFKILGEPLHIDGIVDLSVCAWKPIIMTASKDQTVRIWNFETEKTELVKKYQVDITGIELHQTGLMAAVGFSDQLRLMQILLDDFKVLKAYNFPRCRDAIFSNNGHLMAAAYNNVIAIVSVFTFETIKTLKGHNGTVLSVAWSKNDKFIVSTGIEGAVYQWDVETGARVHEVVEKGTEYHAVALSSDMSSTYAVTNLGVLRDIANSEIVRQIKPPVPSPLLAITLSRSDLVMFISSEHGHLYNVQLPFLETGGGTCTNYRFFHGAVTKLKITYDDTMLVTVSSRGTLAVWVILNNAGKIAQLDQDLGKCTEVLIPRDLLVDKNEMIASMELRMKQQIHEFEHKLKQTEIGHADIMRELHAEYNDKIRGYKAMNRQTELAHVEQLKVITTNMAKDKEDQLRELNAVEMKFNSRITIEYQKTAAVKRKLKATIEDYDNKLKMAGEHLESTVQALEANYRKELGEKQSLISQLMQEMEEKKNEFHEYCRQVDQDNDRNMVDMQLQYEKRLKDEQDATTKWREEAGIFNKKFAATTKEVDKHLEEIVTLKEEYERNQKTIDSCHKDNYGLQHEIGEWEGRLSEKEKSIQELMKKNQEFEKILNIRTHEIAEMRNQIEPRERQIMEQRNHCAEIERELEALHQTVLNLELKSSELKDKYNGCSMELNQERAKRRSLHNKLSNVCGEIARVTTDIQRPNKLKEGVKRLYQNFSGDADLSRELKEDEDVECEFLRQRKHFEKLIAQFKQKSGTTKDSIKVQKLMRDNLEMLEEINKLRASNKEAELKSANMEALLGIGAKQMSRSVAREKLRKACADYDEIEMKFKTRIEKFQILVDSLTEENRLLRINLAKYMGDSRDIE